MLIQNLLPKLTNTDNRGNLNLKKKKNIYIYISFLGTNAVHVRFLSIYILFFIFFSKLSFAMRCNIELVVAIFSPLAI